MRRSDVVAGLFTLVGGALGVIQLLVSWVSTPIAAGESTSLDGWTLFQLSRVGASFSTSTAISAYSILATGIAGGVLVVLGIMMLIPMPHHVLGGIALLMAVIAVAGAVWWLIQSSQTLGLSIGDLFSSAGPGLYFFLVGGLLALVGALKAILTA